MKEAGVMLLAVFGVIAPAPSARVFSGAPAQITEMPPEALCLPEARERARKFVEEGGDPELARRQLEIDFVLCRQPSIAPETASFIGTVNFDRARFALAFLQRRMPMRLYLQALDDRERKLERFKDDLVLHQALIDGDDDADLIPDAFDQCAKTRDGTPTDDLGCPEIATGKQEGRAPDGWLLKALSEARTLYNPSCEDAPQPKTPFPIAWGNDFEKVKLRVSRVDGQPPGCDIFYEIHLQFIDPADASLPPSVHATVVFHESEDIDTIPDIIVFHLAADSTLSPGRTKARDAFMAPYRRVRWKVRAVNGSNRTSPWSPVVTRGPTL